jgi:carboxymethylenebutenolidase
MDIARPDIREKKERRRTILTGVAVLLACVAFVALWIKRSPHHHEYVTLRHDARTLQALVVYPEIKNKAPVVILVHEIYGLSDWATQMADQLADEGFIVVAPDLLSGYGPSGGGYSDFASENDRVQAISSLDHVSVMADLDATADFAKKLPASNGKLAIVGFSWGGWKTFAFATQRKDLTAVFVFYGTGPEDVTTITAPVFGFYAGQDAGVDVTVHQTTEAMRAAGKFYDPVTYNGAEHGFMRLGADFTNRVQANKTARDQAFARLIKLLRQMNSTPISDH